MTAVAPVRRSLLRPALRMLLLPSSRNTWERFGWRRGLTLLVATSAVALWRVRGSLDRMWAEDWVIYVRQAKVLGCHPLQGYAGYAQVPARLVGCMTARAPIERWPLLLAVSAALVCGLSVTGIAWLLWSAGMQPWAACGAGSVLVLAPTAPSEVLDVMANTQWVLIPSMVLMMLWRPRSWLGAALAAVALLAGATDSVLVFTLLPLVLLRLVALPLRSRDQVVTAGMLIGMGVQALVAFGPDPGVRPPVPPLPGTGSMAATIVARVTLSPLGPTAGEGAFHTSGWVVPATMLLLLVTIAVTGGWPARLVLAYAAALEALVTVLAWFPPWQAIGHEISLAFGDRYLVPTGVLLVLGGVMGPLRSRHPGPPILVGAALLVLSLAGTVTDLRNDDTRTQTRPWSQVLSDARVQCATGSVSDVSLEAAPHFATTLPCTML